MSAPKARYLTKSRFKVGSQCPAKLNYLDNDAYGNNNVDDAFLKALADGGFQVGELAKIYFPGGIEVKTKEHKLATAETAELMKQENVVIFEAAFLVDALFLRADIVVKRGKFLEIIEVKSATFKPSTDSFYGKRQPSK
ncbi:MAG: DUF2779 domain-containing protein, partial [Bdellovibrionota bacterium]